MLSIIVRLKECNAQVQLEHDAPNRPDIARLRPAQLENHLWCAVMTCRYNSAVMLVIEGRGAEVDESDVGAFDAANFAVLKMMRNYEIFR
jgi:hypothetical protein